MLPNTSKGIELLQSSDLLLFERPIEEAIAGNDQLRHPVKKTLGKSCLIAYFR